MPTGPRDFLIYEDKHVLAFAKPAGLAAQGGSGISESLDRMLEAAWPGRRPPRLVHRLDRETTGVIIAGRTPRAIAFLSAAFAARTAEKVYLAIVCGGAPEPPCGLIEAPLIKEKRRGVDLMRSARAGERGAEAVTGYETLAAHGGAALVLARPRTGRMHQIRAHCALLGRPIFGDGKYGGLFALGPVRAPGLMLHALTLVAPHPDGGRLRLAAAPPATYKEISAGLRLEAEILGTETEAARVKDAPAEGSPP